MTQRDTRRRFLGQLATVSLGAVVVPSVARVAAAASSGTKLPVTCRDAMLRRTGKPDCWSALRAIDAEGVEADVDDDLSLRYLFHPERKYSLATEAGIARLRADADAAGQVVAALCMSNRFDERPEAEVEWCRKTAAAAQAAGVKVVRIDVAPRKMKDSRDEYLKFSIETLKKVIAATEQTGVAFAIENHGNTTNDPAFLLPLLDGVGSPRLGVTLDTANFYWFGHPLSKLYELYEQLAPRVLHTHCKNINYPAEKREAARPMGWEYGRYHGPLYEGDIDLRRVVAILKKAGYRGDLCIEDESLGKRSPAESTEILGKEVQFLKEIR